ncbi:MAG: ATP phosphoribosyltransferase [Bdellovibrionota bacterium]
MEKFSLAIAKGRVLEDSVALLAAGGYSVEELSGDSRKLVFDLPRSNLRVLVVRSQDVPTYVDRGAADAGIVGKDVLEEQRLGLYEPLDLGVSRCRLVVAAPREKSNGKIGPLRIATKYPSLAREHFSRKGIHTEIVHLYGAIELAPLTGIADKIVDLVDTGRTLKENGLAEEEIILQSTARLVIGRASLRLKEKDARDLLARLSEAGQKNAVRREARP